MPRLTRTQKFADLRDSLANDKESSLQTKDLSSYESRLNNIIGEEIRPQEPVREVSQEAPKEEAPKEDPKYVWTPFEDTQTEAENAEDVIDLTITDLWNSARIGEEKKEEPVTEPVYTEAPVEEKTEEVVSEPVYEEPAVTETPTVEPVVEEQPVVTEVPAVEPTVEEQPVVTETPAVEPTVEEQPAAPAAITDYILEDPFAEFDEILSEKYAREEKKEETEVPVEPVREPVQEEVNITETPVEEEKTEEIFTVSEPVEEKAEPLVEDTPIFEEPVVEETPVYEESTVEEPANEEPLTLSEGPIYEEAPAEEEEELDADKVETEPVKEENPYLGLYQRNPEVEAAYEAAAKAAEEEAARLEAEKEEAVVEEAPAVEEPVVEEPTVEVSAIEEVPTFEEPVVEETPVVEVPVTEEQPASQEEAELVAEEPVVEETPVDEKTYELPADNHMPEDLEERTNDLLHETISEVDKYNEENGDLTIHTLTSNMVNEIRHGESAPTVEKAPVEEIREVPAETFEEVPAETFEEVPAEEFKEVPVNTVDENEEEFSNTVSMEISKIMNEVAEDENANEIPVEEVVAPVVEEHPVLTKALEEEPEEEVVEIRNLNELDENPVQNTLSNTIPFVVAPSDDEEVIDEEAEEDSNTILNIILIILIVILVAVLGLIIFYILKTKGII